MLTQTATKTKQLNRQELSALYDRIYDIADRLFKKHNPCNIQAKDNKTKCINSQYNRIHLCCQYWLDRCGHWQNGCTIKCLACKLFICGKIRNNKREAVFVKNLNRLRRITNKYGFSNLDYYTTKEKALQMRNKTW